MTTGDQVVAGGLVVMLIASFLPWISVSLGTVLGQDLGSLTVNGYHSWGFLFWVVTYLLIALWILRVLLPDAVAIGPLPVTDAVLYLAGGAIAIVGALLYQVHDTGAYTGGFGSFSDLGWGWFVALAGAIILLVGGYLKQQEPTAGTAFSPPNAGSYGATPPYRPGPPQQPPPQAGPPSQAPPRPMPPQQPPPPGGSPPPPPA